MRESCFILILTLLSFTTHAQNNELLCRVVETTSEIPISFATVRIKSSSLGVIADADGHFRIPYKYKQNKDTIVITAIGYKSTEVLLTNLTNGKINIIPVTIQIESLKVIGLVHKKKGKKKKKKLSARQIVQKAIDNITINLPRSDHSYVGYYRDYKLLDEEYVNLNEGVVEVFDKGIQTDKYRDTLNQSVLYSYSLNENFKRNKLLEKPYDNKSSNYIKRKSKFIKGARISPLGGNELSILDLHNPIRNYNRFSFSFIDVFKDDFIQNHDFELLKQSVFEDVVIYEIGFSALISAHKHQYRIVGKIYIQKDNYAIHKIIYDAFRANRFIPFEGIQYSGNAPVQNVEEFRPSFSLQLEYASRKKGMYLNYISFNNEFKIDNGEGFKVEDFIYDQEENAFFVQFNAAIQVNVNSQLGKTISIGEALLLGLNNIQFGLPGSFAEVYDIRNYNIKYKGNHLKINNIEAITPDQIKIIVKGNPLGNINSRDLKRHLKYEIYNLEDIYGRTLNVEEVLDVYQFREFFVQEVFPDRVLPINLEFVKKAKNLTKSKINDLDKASRYWVNTPLKEIGEGFN